METAAAPVWDICKSAAIPVARQFGYLVWYKNKIDKLRMKMGELGSMEIDVTGQVNLDERGGLVVKNVVKEWLVSVREIQIQVIELNLEDAMIYSRFKGWCCGRYLLGRDSKRLTERVIELLNQRKGLTDVAGSMSLPPMDVGKIIKFSSRKAIMNQLISALESDEINLVGVYRLGGIGKTAMMKELCKNVQESELFEEVVMVIVSQNPDTKKIQFEIAESLGMTLKEENPLVRSSRLSARLKQGKRVLVILDDLWNMLKLEELGIPLGDEDHLCKVVFTTRSYTVCTSMQSEKNIKVQELNEEDSWELFRQKGGDVVYSEIAREVSKGCKGLPLSIVTLANALRGKDQGTWRDAAHQLRDYSSSSDMALVISSIKMSYQYLENEEAQLCLLFCCLFPEDYKISMNELLGYATTVNLLGDTETLEKSRTSLMALVSKLTSSCLLSKFDNNHVMMHDIVREAAISIASEKNNGFIVKAGRGLKRWPNMETVSKIRVSSHRNCLRMSVMGNQIRELPTEIECPKLVNLLLANNESLKVIPDGFFLEMKVLVTLDLSHTGISSLPESISCLIKLQVLWLEECHMLKDISTIGNLTTLEMLSLKGCLHVRRLPEALKKLTKLKLLNLSDTKRLQSVPAKIVSSWHCLEELHMQKSFNGWKIEGKGSGSRATLSEVASLNGLTTLCLDINDVKLLTEALPLHYRNYKEFSIDASKRTCRFGYPKSMGITTKLYPVAEWVISFLVETNELILCKCTDLVNVVQLKAGVVDHLRSSGNYRKWWDSLIFSNLIRLDISDCPCLKYLFPIEIARGLLQLEELNVRSCIEIEEMFTKYEENDTNTMIFCKLKIFRLHFLPKLSWVYQQRSVLQWPRLQIFEIWDCPMLKRLPLRREGAPMLQKILVNNSEWYEDLEWEDKNIKSELKSFLKTSRKMSAMTKVRTEMKATQKELDKQRRMKTTKMTVKDISEEKPATEDSFSDRLRSLPTRHSNAGSITRLAYTPSSLVNGIPIIHIKSADYGESIKEFESFLVGNFVESRLSYCVGKETFESLWNLKGSFEVKLHGPNLFFFKFNYNEDRNTALDLGILHIESRLFVVRPWRPYIESDSTELDSVPVCVTLMNIPEHLCNSDVIGKIASTIGRPSFTDQATENGLSFPLAHVWVDVEVGRSLLYQIPLVIDGSKTIQIVAEYTWKPLKCIHCARAGDNICIFSKTSKQSSIRDSTEVWARMYTTCKGNKFSVEE